jgi:hypothetical protein
MKKRVFAFVLMVSVFTVSASIAHSAVCPYGKGKVRRVVKAIKGASAKHRPQIAAARPTINDTPKPTLLLDIAEVLETTLAETPQNPLSVIERGILLISALDSLHKKVA